MEKKIKTKTREKDEGLMMTDEEELLGRQRSSESQKKTKTMEKQKEEKMRED